MPDETRQNAPAAFRLRVAGTAGDENGGFVVNGEMLGGRLNAGETILNARTGESATLERLEGVPENGDAPAFGPAQLTLSRRIAVQPGDLLSGSTDAPVVADQLAVDLSWTSAAELIPGRQYLVRFGPRPVPATVTELRYRLDEASGEHLAAKTLAKGESGRCNLSLAEPVAFDAFEENEHTGAFDLVDSVSGEILGRGQARFALRRAQNLRWQALTVNRAARTALLGQTPALLWFTGLSGAGKSTIADIVEKKLHAAGRHTYILDGDNVRHGLNRDLGFTDADRVENIRRVVEVSRLMLDAGLIVIASFISPFRAERRMARELVGADFVEIHVRTPLNIAEARDPKGLYARARAGKLANFTGIDSPYEEPETPDLVLDTMAASAEDLASRVIEHLERRS